MLRRITLVAALIAALLYVPTPASAAGKPAAPKNEKPTTVTLITGDRVTVGANGTATIDRGPGRKGERFMTYRAAGHLTVIPTDALPLLRDGRLDRRLFDVTTLAQYGYDDRRADLPLIVTYTADNARITMSGAQVTRQLPTVDSLAVRAEHKSATAFWTGLVKNKAVAKVWLDGLRKTTLDESVPQIGAPAAWAAGYDGTGVTAAVLDTGIDATHPDLTGQVVAEQNFVEEFEDARDLVGHGTHVSSTIAGTGAASDGRFRGVAPGAKLLDGKVCFTFGCPESSILAGMQWAAEQGADVVNMSLGGSDTPEVDPIEQAVDALTAQFGTLFVIAAGNSGTFEPVSSPATADSALAVGAVDKSDQIAEFSSRGPRLGDGAVKPEITAPGVDITAANSKDGFLGEPGESYTTLSGTSMATPHVVGSAAILAQLHPDWSPAELKAGLMGSAKTNPELTVTDQGAGRVDVARAIGETVTVDSGSVSFGRQLWPHSDDAAVTKTVTYRNHGTAEVTLDLTLNADAPAGMFELSAPTVTVPAGGTAEVTVTADTRVEATDRFYGGYLTATAGDLVVRTPFGVDREVESYDLTLTHTDRAGQPAANYDTVILRADEVGIFFVYDPDGTVERRLPKGRYVVLTIISGGTEEAPEYTLLAQPRLDLTSTQTMSLDARVGRPVTVDLPGVAATPAFTEVTIDVQTPGIELGGGLLGETFDGLYSGQIGADAPELISKVGAVFVRPGPGGDTTDAPDVYNLAWFAENKLFTGFSRTVRANQLATVRTEYARHVDGALGEKGVLAVLPGRLEGGVLPALQVHLPFTRTEHFNTEPGVHWLSIFDEAVPGEEFADLVSIFYSANVRYEARRHYTERWNSAVFGPTLAAPYLPDVWVTRLGDTIVAIPPLFGDGAGREGYSIPDTTGRTTLYRNGTKFAEVAELGGVFDVPADAADYRLEFTASRGAPFTLSTSVSATWTFRSGHVDGTDPARLPLSAVVFSPRLDTANTAPAGRTFAVPLSVVPQPGSAARPVRNLAVEASFDDGQTWRRVPVRHGQAFIEHPDSHGFVSLRVAATDRAGNTVRETVIRAYQIAP